MQGLSVLNFLIELGAFNLKMDIEAFFFLAHFFYNSSQHAVAVWLRNESYFFRPSQMRVVYQLLFRLILDTKSTLTGLKI